MTERCITTLKIRRFINNISARCDLLSQKGGEQDPAKKYTSMTESPCGGHDCLATKGIEEQNYIRNVPPDSAPPSSYDETLPEPIADSHSDPENPRVLNFEEVTSAAFKIKSGIYFTPCDPSHLQYFTPINVFLKKDFMQYTGSFKERGARYALIMLSREQKEKGVIAASAGNHAQALCYHGKLLKIPVTVIMPTTAPIMKVQNCRAFGGNVLVKGKDMTESKRWAMYIGKERGLTYINGYDHIHILAGQGTCGLEILEQVPDVDAIVVPVGGGGLIAGIAVAVKTLKPDCKIIAVESTACPGFASALAAGKPTFTPMKSTLADGLAVSMVGHNAFATAARLVDQTIQVPEEWIALAILRLLELEKCIVEGAGAVPVAAVLAGSLDEYAGKKIVLVLSGGNIDTTVLGRVIDRGLAADGRLVKFSVEIMDRPGGLQDLCFLLGSIGVSIKDIAHERAWIKSDVFKVRTKVICETRSMDHAKQLEEELLNKYDLVHFGDAQRGSATV